MPILLGAISALSPARPSPRKGRSFDETSMRGERFVVMENWSLGIEDLSLRI